MYTIEVRTVIQTFSLIIITVSMSNLGKILDQNIQCIIVRVVKWTAFTQGKFPIPLFPKRKIFILIVSWTIVNFSGVLRSLKPYMKNSTTFKIKREDFSKKRNYWYIFTKCLLITSEDSRRRKSQIELCTRQLIRVTFVNQTYKNQTRSLKLAYGQKV